MRRSRSRSRSSSVETGRSRSKKSKLESLKPVGNYLTSLLNEHGLSSIKSRVVVNDILDRLVTGGYGWDKMILYHAKVLHLLLMFLSLLQGEERFIKKLIPYIFMSKDDFPEDLMPDMVLSKLYECIQEWNSKLFNMISQESKVNKY